MLIHRITHLPYKGMNPTKEFGGKTGQKDLAKRMNRDYGLMKKSQGYSILSIIDLKIQLATQVLVGKVMRKCHMNEVLVPVVSLAT